MIDITIHRNATSKKKKEKKKKIVGYSRMTLVVQWGCANEYSRKPNTYLKSAKCEDSSEPIFYDRKRIFQKMKKLSSSFST